MTLTSTSNFVSPAVAQDPDRLVIVGSVGENTGAELSHLVPAEIDLLVQKRSKMRLLRAPIISAIARNGPDAGGIGIETVIIDDNRVRVMQTRESPWRMICTLSIVGQNDVRAVGTGWFIGPRTLVTAGHCVHHPDLDGWAQRIEVSPGRNDSELPYGTTVAQRFSALEAWTTTHAPEFDFGCIHLDEPLGDRTGWFSLAPVEEVKLKNGVVTIAGYPADRGQGTELYRDSQRILRIDPQRLFYDVDTFGGQSGAPAWLEPGAGPTPTVVGIHAYGILGTPADYGIVANSATRLTPPVLAEITRWRAQSDAI